MTTIRHVPAGLLHALGIHKGDFLTVRDETPTAYVIEITTAHPPSESGEDQRQAALARFAVGVETPQPATEQELDDARFTYLRSKHLK